MQNLGFVFTIKNLVETTRKTIVALKWWILLGSNQRPYECESYALVADTRQKQLLSSRTNQIVKPRKLFLVYTAPPHNSTLFDDILIDLIHFEIPDMSVAAGRVEALVAEKSGNIANVHPVL